MNLGLISLVTDKTDPLIAAGNFTVAICMFVLCGIIIRELVRHEFNAQSSLRLIMFGVLLEALGWGLHRIYWGSWRLTKELELSWAPFFQEHAWLALLPILVILTGMTVILTPVWCQYLGKRLRTPWCFMGPATLILTTYWFLFELFDK